MYWDSNESVAEQKSNLHRLSQNLHDYTYYFAMEAVLSWKALK